MFIFIFYNDINFFFLKGTRSLVEACIEGDIAAVRKLLDEGRSVHEPTDEGESLLSLACSAGKFFLNMSKIYKMEQ